MAVSGFRLGKAAAPGKAWAAGQEAEPWRVRSEMMGEQRKTMGSHRGRRLLAICLILALLPACSPAQVYIPLAYAITGMCIALLMSPTLTAAVVGLVVGGLLGAAVYNNSLKHQIQERQRSEPPPLPGTGNRETARWGFAGIKVA